MEFKTDAIHADVKCGRVKYDDGLQQLSRKLWQDVGGLSRDAALLRQRANSLAEENYPIAAHACREAASELALVVMLKKAKYHTASAAMLSKRGKKYL